MTSQTFNSGWRVGPNVSVFAEVTGGATSAHDVTLPHDAMLDMPRRPEAPGGSSTGYFEGGAVIYRKDFFAPESWADRCIYVDFEGVYRDAMVYLNGVLVGQRPNGYVPFRVPLDGALRYGQDNQLRVDARAHRDTRWYSGLGIYRSVALHDLPLVHVVPGRIRVTTPDVDADRAVVDVALDVFNALRAASTGEVRVRMLDPDGTEVSASDAIVTVRPNDSATARVRLYVDEPRRWSVESPALYELVVEMLQDGVVAQQERVAFGIRTLQLDPKRGLRINGVETKLRGACIHHDNGLLGAVSVPEAELRRVAILKEAGFNAVRSSHNTASSALLDACDRLGMLVIDESFDMWTESKQPFDYSLAFPEWWERDLQSMVEKDFNHPSVIMYSIGNEILDAGKPLGAAIGRDLAEAMRALDPTRFLTNGISGFVATLSDTVPMIQDELKGIPGGINDVQGRGKEILDRVSRSEFVTAAIAESHSVVDVAGHNYAAWRYEAERQRYPHRVVVGTETNPKDIAENWALVGRMPWVIGDFTWTGWDYLGEAGLGMVAYPAEGKSWDADAFPALLAYCGDIDITGFRRPASYFREIVFGLRPEPFIAVHAPQQHGRTPAMLDWAWTDSLAEWTWDVAPGTEMTVDVYSDADEIELLLNGEPLDRRAAGVAHGFIATFSVPYEAGELTAVAWRDNVRGERTTLRTTGDVSALSARAVGTGLRDEYEYIALELHDADGRVVPHDDRVVEVRVEGAAVLVGLGSARPVTEESYLSGRTTTFNGRAQAIIRRNGDGPTVIAVSSDGLGATTTTV